MSEPTPTAPPAKPVKSPSSEPAIPAVPVSQLRAMVNGWKALVKEAQRNSTRLPFSPGVLSAYEDCATQVEKLCEKATTGS